MKTVIIGGVAGGASAAARLRRLDESAQIVILERTGFVSYANCGLPYYVGDVITNKSKLTLQTPESFATRFNIDARVNSEAVSIDRVAKHVHVVNRATGEEYDEPYDTLVLSPGAKPLLPDIEGADSARAHVLRTVEDTFALRELVDSQVDAERPRRMVVVGGGFIGLEAAENLRERGLEVTLVQRDAHVLPILDADMAQLVHQELATNGVDLCLSSEVIRVQDVDGGIVVHLSDGDAIEAAGILFAIGVVPDTKLAREAGLELGAKGSIKVDEYMRTSDPFIFAVGDAIQTTRFETGDEAVIPLAGPANKQGRLVAEAIASLSGNRRGALGDASRRAWHGSQGTSVLKVFDLTVSATGLTDGAAKAAGIPHDHVILQPPSHASYYPGSSAITLKVLFDTRSGRILGAQAIGREGVEKRIDVLATAIRARMDADDLAELDLAYAPPFSSAKDPVNMAGFMIENIMDGLVEQVHWSEAIAELATGASADGAQSVLLDVRTDAEYRRGHVRGAVHIPLDSLRARMEELPRNTHVNVHCQTGLRSYIACRILSQNGIACRNVAGGYSFLEATRVDGAGPCGMA